MSQAIAAPQDNTVRGFLSKPQVQQGIADAIGKWMDPQTFMAQMMIALSDPKFAKCTVASQFRSVHLCATLGLLPAYQQVALIPRKKKVGEQWTEECTVMPQWQGLKALMERHPDILEVQPYLVYKTDVFETSGTVDAMVPVHSRPNALACEANSIEDIQGGYAKITYRDGRPAKFVFATVSYIERCMKCSESLKNREKAIKDKKDYVPACPWTDGWFEQQALKTVLRNTYSRRAVPIDPMIAGRVEAFLREEDSILGNDPRIIDSPAPALPPVSRSSYIAGQIANRRTEPAAQVEQKFGLEPGTLTGSAPDERSPETSSEAQPAPDPPSIEPAAGELPPETEAEQPKSLMGEFLDLLAETKNRGQVDRLENHYLGDQDVYDKLTAEERDTVRTMCASRRAEYAPSGPAAPAGRKQKSLPE